MPQLFSHALILTSPQARKHSIGIESLILPCLPPFSEFHPVTAISHDNDSCLLLHHLQIVADFTFRHYKVALVKDPFIIPHFPVQPSWGIIFRLDFKDFAFTIKHHHVSNRTAHPKLTKINRASRSITTKQKVHQLILVNIFAAIVLGNGSIGPSYQARIRLAPKTILSTKPIKTGEIIKQENIGKGRAREGRREIPQPNHALIMCHCPHHPIPSTVSLSIYSPANVPLFIEIALALWYILLPKTHFSLYLAAARTYRSPYCCPYLQSNITLTPRGAWASQCPADSIFSHTSIEN